jgi:hypothetical protein
MMMLKEACGRCKDDPRHTWKQHCFQIGKARFLFVVGRKKTCFQDNIQLIEIFEDSRQSIMSSHVLVYSLNWCLE